MIAAPLKVEIQGAMASELTTKNLSAVKRAVDAQESEVD
jgi:hypothetical protein